MCRKYSKDNRRRKGLSIIEVSMASVLLIVAMVPILRSLTKANMMSSSIEIKTQCLVLAQGKLDNIRAKPPTVLVRQVLLRPVMLFLAVRIFVMLLILLPPTRI